MADHLDAPGLISPNSDPRVDITDHYAFQKPGNHNNKLRGWSVISAKRRAALVVR
jgi:hypothetical protein